MSATRRQPALLKKRIRQQILYRPQGRAIHAILQQPVRVLLGIYVALHICISMGYALAYWAVGDIWSSRLPEPQASAQ